MPNQQQDFKLSPYWVDGINALNFDWGKFQDKIDSISDDLFNLLVDETTSEFINKVGQTYAQINPRIADLSRIIRDTILADIYIGDLPSEISNRLGVDPNTGREIANQIVSQLFTPTLDDIKKLQAAKFPGRINQQPPTPQQSVPMPTDRPPVPLPPQHKIIGEDLPETGGNIIDLRNQS